MKKLIILTALLSLSACTNTVPKGGQFAYTSKPTFCYQLPPQEQSPAVNCIGSGGGK